ncbi:MAG: hypothetical protein ACP5N2_06275 [Candidatus Nanoarchaeia archaeon]
MSSTLILVEVEKLQEHITKAVEDNCSTPLIYVSLNKPHESVDASLKERGIDTKKIFFIDCLTNEQKSEEVILVNPTQLDKLNQVIDLFIKEIPGKKALIVDALSTLLIYNNENKVALFVKEVTEYAARKDVEIIALSPKTQGEELLNKIFNFFNVVNKK